MEEPGTAGSEPAKKPFEFHPKFKQAVFIAGGLTLMLYMTFVVPQRFMTHEITSNPTKVVEGCFIEGRDIEYHKGGDEYIVTTNCGVFHTQSSEHLNSLTPWDKYTFEVSTGENKYIIAAVNEKDTIK
jgi:hypothetical protein